MNPEIERMAEELLGRGCTCINNDGDFSTCPMHDLLFDTSVLANPDYIRQHGLADKQAGVAALTALVARAEQEHKEARAATGAGPDLLDYLREIVAAGKQS
jgi:hypothetical protein